ncbi:hypothetical protein Gohar_024455 [Gossypium harknessii]|uniref:Endoglucanase n=1 Tax=Gossypium harknessii TaxID=34285 RepID=A0A7J9HG63_9ROSI|nr:hypothetical protein [Gossypium harknessii]
MGKATILLIFLCSLVLLLLGGVRVEGNPNYRDALQKSILFFQGQRSGKLPANQKVSWRSNSGLSDGSLDHVDLTGGYYDAGDNVKFNFPMAFTTTMLSWGTLEYGKRMGPQLQEARAAIRWATDYLLKCANSKPGKLYVGVGDPNVDHKCWERPEDMDTVRTVYSVSSSNPGSDVAGETAAALAAASLVFRRVDPKYSRLLLQTARKVMAFAIQYRGAYSDSLGSAVCPFYCSYSGYKDELLWGAAWLFRATNDAYYYNFLKTLGADDQPDIFSWDNKYAGAHVLLSRVINIIFFNPISLHCSENFCTPQIMALLGKDKNFEQFKQEAESFMCRILPNSPYSTTQYTQGDLNNFMYNSYVDYILGENPIKMSYMVGFGRNFPKRIHHRGSSLPSLAKHPQSIGCDGGFQPYFYSSNPNPNILVGAIVGGPNQNDGFPDDRSDYSHSEPSTYITAALVGPLAYFSH